jgi:hypothetical protein
LAQHKYFGKYYCRSTKEFNIEVNVICTINSMHRIAATLCTLETWFVSGISVNAPHKGENDDDDDDDDNILYLLLLVFQVQENCTSYPISVALFTPWNNLS